MSYGRQPCYITIALALENKKVPPLPFVYHLVSSSVMDNRVLSLYF